jgi:hypothetical protein
MQRSLDGSVSFYNERRLHQGYRLTRPSRVLARLVR